MDHPNQYRYFIGVDVSKSELDFAVVEANQILFHVEVSNDKKGIQDFFRQLKALDQGDIKHSLFCLEHTATADRGYLQQPTLIIPFPKASGHLGREGYSNPGKYGRKSHEERQSRCH